MRLLCPFCQKAITVPDTAAGQPVDCPECGQEFAAPQLYTPAPAPLPAEKPAQPAPVRETYVNERRDPAPSVVELPDMPAPDRELDGYETFRSVTLQPRVIRWIPAVTLFLAFVLTLFPWNGLYPAGYPAFTQTPWGAAISSMSRDKVADDELRVGGEKLGDILEQKLRMNWWLIPYLLLLIPTLALAIAGPLVDQMKWKVPPGLQQVWDYRPAILGVLTVLLLLILLAQWASGFGLQRAVNDWIETDFAATREAANTDEKLQRWEMQVAMKKGEYHVRTTRWLRLALLMHLLATVAVITEAGLMLRGKKPVPRLAAMW